MARYRFDPNTGKVLPAHMVPRAVRGPRSENVATPYFMGDLKPFVNVVTRDTHEITSRSQLRNFERSTGFRQVGNDFEPGTIAREHEQKKAEWEAAAKTVDHGWTDFDG